MIAISMTPSLRTSDSDKSARVASRSEAAVAFASGLTGPQESSAPGNMITVPNPLASPTVSIHDGKVNKRPKLSLQTTSLPVTFGKSTTGLSLTLSTNCTSSPTVRNTFNNAYDGFRGPSSPALAAAASPTRPGSRSSRRGSPYVGGRHHKDDIPYQLPLGVRGILRNSPIPASSLRSSSTANNSPGAGHSGRRKLFPAKKHVNYRFPIDEEIKTVRFVAKHSDITSSESSSGPSDSSTSEDEGSDSSTSPGGSAPSEEDSATTSDATASNRSTQRTKRKVPRSERQIRAAAIRDGLPDHDYEFQTPQTPQTPLQRHRKRQRKWRWTLGPVENGQVLIPSAGHPSPASAIAYDDRPLLPSAHHTPATPSIAVPLLGPPSKYRWKPSPVIPRSVEGVADSSHDAIHTPLPGSLGSSPGASPSPSDTEG